MNMTEINKNQEQQEKVVEKVVIKEIKVWDTYSYKWWLNSDSFIKRALAVVWYNFVGTILLYLMFVLIIVVIAIIYTAIRHWIH